MNYPITDLTGGQLGNQDNNITISYEKRRIEIPLNLGEYKDKIICDVLNDLQARVSSLEEELKREKLLSSSHLERNISDEEARKEIIDFIKELRKEGKTRLSIINLVSRLYLPPEQIERVMESLEGKKI